MRRDGGKSATYMSVSALVVMVPFEVGKAREPHEQWLACLWPTQLKICSEEKIVAPNDTVCRPKDLE